MANKIFTVEDQNGNQLCTSTSKLVNAKQYAMNKSQKIGMDVQVIERDADWKFVRLRGLVSNNRYTTVTQR